MRVVKFINKISWKETLLIVGEALYPAHTLLACEPLGVALEQRRWRFLSVALGGVECPERRGQGL
jgi:hypothetical protein